MDKADVDDDELKYVAEEKDFTQPQFFIAEEVSKLEYVKVSCLFI